MICKSETYEKDEENDKNGKCNLCLVHFHGYKTIK